MTAEELIDLYLQTDQDEVVGPLEPKRPRRKTLAQKQGARKGGRTRTRRAQTENKGFLYYNYYDRPRSGSSEVESE